MRKITEKTTLIMAEKKEVEGGGGAPPKKDFPAPPKQDPQPPKKDDLPPKEEGDTSKLDFYKEDPKDPPPGDKKPEGDKQKKDPVEKPEEVEPGTGWDKEPEIEEPPKEDPPPKKEEPPPPTDVDKKLSELHPEFAKYVKSQIEEIGLQGEQLDKFIAQKKLEQKNAMKNQERQEAEMRRQEQQKKQAWYKELKEDPVFGGDKFGANRTRAEKFLDQYGAELKKELTDAKQMLRPSVMRMLMRAADELWPDRQLVQGEPPSEEREKEDGKPNDPLAFYQ